ncbi:MAG TPA: AI-2E family transporter [Candidatus Merdenecus merdavium]|nr:AI-2E family transporter [Candidatus Merdenecus merdavium]
MNKLTFKQKLLLITYGGLVLFFIIHFESIRSLPMTIGNILSPFLIGGVLAFVLNQPTVFFNKRYSKFIKNPKLSRGLAILTSYILLFAIITGVILFVVPKLALNISNFVKNLGNYIGPIETWAIETADKYNFHSIDPEKAFDNLKDSISSIANWLIRYLLNMIPQIVTLASGLVSALYKVIITLVVSINLLAGKERLLSQAKKVVYVYVPKKWAVRTEYVVRLCSDIFGRYVVGQVTEACILGGLCYIGMRFFKFDYGILISTVIAITALVPIAGAWIGGGIAFLLLALISPIKAVLFLIFLNILQQLENNLIYPKVVGGSIGLPGIWVIFAVTAGGGFFGLPGIMLSVPTVSVIYTLIKKDVFRKYPEVLKSLDEDRIKGRNESLKKDEIKKDIQKE